jgi:hypothetical protein
MDNQILSIISIVISVAGTIIAIINHKIIKSKCCGRELDASIDISNTTPPELRIKTPPQPVPYTPV